jgi:hypothetical protein
VAAGPAVARTQREPVDAAGSRLRSAGRRPEHVVVDGEGKAGGQRAAREPQGERPARGHAEGAALTHRERRTGPAGPARFEVRKDESPIPGVGPRPAGSGGTRP